MSTTKGLLLAILLLISLGAIAQTKDVIYIRIQENVSVTLNSYMSISLPDDRTEKIELEKIGFSGKGAEINGILIRKKLKQFINEGYEIETCSTGGDPSISTTIIILTKKE